MRRCLGFLIASATMGVLSARADILYVRVDLSQAHQNVPSTPPHFNAPAVKDAAPPAAESSRPLPPGDGPFAFAAIEAKSKDIKFEGRKDEKFGDYGALVLDHGWGKKARFVTTPLLTPGVLKYVAIHRDSPLREYEKLFKKELATTKDPKKALAAGVWAFEHGLTKEFHAAMEEYAKLAPNSAVVANYRRVAAALKKPPTADDPLLKALAGEPGAGDARYRAVVGDSGFYVGLTNLPTTFDVGVKRRIGRLHETLEKFYYWFALHEQLPQPAFPTQRLLLVVPGSVDEFYAKHARWGAPPFTGDGVTPRRDNVLLMAWRPLDDVYRSLDASNQDLCKKLMLPKDILISGAVWEKGSPALGQDLFQVAFAQTMVLVQKAIEEDSETATLTREGTRQLLFASGVLPRNVHVPEWISQGLASYFETSPGAPYRGVGQPSWSHLVAFQHFRAARKFDAPAEVLRGLALNRYFRAADGYLADLAETPDRDQLSRAIREQLDLANSTAWAFTYYAIERKREPLALFRYCQELSTLPRDLDLDDRALEACFARAFNVADASQPPKIDPAKLAPLAAQWFSEMAGVSLEVPELQNEYLDVRKLAARRAAAQ